MMYLFTESLIIFIYNFLRIRIDPLYEGNLYRKIPPGGIPARKIPTHQTSPWKIPPGKLPPTQFSPGILPPFH